MSTNVKYLNQKARLKQEPFFDVLVSLARTNPELISAEIDRLLEPEHSGWAMTRKEMALFLLGYCQAVTHAATVSRENMCSELEIKTQRIFGKLRFGYRTIGRPHSYLIDEKGDMLF